MIYITNSPLQILNAPWNIDHPIKFVVAGIDESICPVRIYKTRTF